MRFQRCDVDDARVIEPEPHTDERGRFMRSWCIDEFAEHGIEFQPVQANMGLSLKKGTIRGMHYQVAPALEAKLVRCTRGSIFDVVADLRPDSPTYLQWHGVVLTPDNGAMLYVPEGCAHGALSLKDETEIQYFASARYAPDFARGRRFDDPAIAIEWPIPVIVASEQDRSWPLIEQVAL
jgi:dTDP-4-dehydrorhamnose 3,5-epimerase